MNLKKQIVEGRNIRRLLFLGLTILLWQSNLTAYGQSGTRVGAPDSQAKIFRETEEVEAFAFPALDMDSLTLITPPVSVQTLPVDDDADESRYRLRVTNKSEKTISRFVARVYLIREKGEVTEFSHTSDRWFGDEQRGELVAGASFVITLENAGLPKDLKSVAGMAKSVDWKDGTQWPSWTGPAPQPTGDEPVAIRLKGIVSEGEHQAPLVEFFNFSREVVERLEYQISYFDAEGKQLHQSTRTRLGGIQAGEGFAHVGEQGVPRETSRVTAVLNFVTFDDGKKWRPKQ